MIPSKQAGLEYLRGLRGPTIKPSSWLTKLWRKFRPLESVGVELRNLPRGQYMYDEHMRRLGARLAAGKPILPNFAGGTVPRLKTPRYMRLMNVEASLAPEMSKRAQFLQAFASMPFSALAAALTAPEGDRKRAAGLGALFGAGMAAMAQKELAARQARGENVSESDMIPLFNVVMAGLATGGGLRALRERERTGNISGMTAIMAGVPAGALAFPGNPAFGGIAAALLAPQLARMAGKTVHPSEGQIRARRAILAARLRLLMARRAVMARMMRGEGSAP